MAGCFSALAVTTLRRAAGALRLAIVVAIFVTLLSPAELRVEAGRRAEATTEWVLVRLWVQLLARPRRALAAARHVCHSQRNCAALQVKHHR